MKADSEFDFENQPWILVRTLIEEGKLTKKEISEITKYSYGYVCELSRRLPVKKEMAKLKYLQRCAPDLLQSLKLMVETFDKTAIDKNAVLAINVAKQSIEKAEK